MVTKPPEEGGPIVLHEDPDTGDRLLPYVGKDGVQVDLRVGGETFWATQSQMAEMFGVTRQTITRHLKNIYAEGELEPEATSTENVLVGPDGKRRETYLYNLNATISVGYRIGSRQGTLFRIWATEKLVQYLTKGFAIDAERLKAPGDQDRIAELRDLVRDIRAAEANVYAELRRICAMCQDYDPASEAARQFYTRMQAKLYWAVVSHTPSMVLVERADADVENMGLRTWPKTDIRQQDAIVAKNYLGDRELHELNRLTTILLDIFEDQLDIGRLTMMSEAEDLLDAQLRGLSRAVLSHGGSVKSETAVAHAKAEYKKFDEKRRLLRAAQKADELANLRASEKALPKPKKARPKKS